MTAPGERTQPPFMARARELGACVPCTTERDAPDVQREHPDCYRRILDAMHERYGHIDRDRLRMALYLDGVR